MTSGIYFLDRVQQTFLNSILYVLFGHAVLQLVEHYKPKYRGFDSRWDHWDFSLALGSTQSLTEMSTKDVSYG